MLLGAFIAASQCMSGPDDIDTVHNRNYICKGSVQIGTLRQQEWYEKSVCSHFLIFLD